MGVPLNHPAIAQAVERGLIPAPAGEPAAKPARRSRAAAAGKPVVRLVVWLPGVLPRSEANAGGRRRDKIARKTGVKAAVAEALRDVPTLNFRLPTPVTLTRVGGKKLDRHDNLPRSMKAVVDAVSEWLNVDDGDESAVRWRYRQKPGFESGTEITIG